MMLAIVPAYNEEKTIGSVVQSLFGYVDRIVVVDDASADTTYEEAKRAGAVVVRHKVNLGQGAALETGHAYARSAGADYVLHFDADGQFCVDDIRPALKKLQETGADILFGSRFLDNRSHIPRLKRYVLLPMGTVVNRLFGVVRLRDSQNGFRILTKHALSKVRITQNRMAHATEIMGLTKQHGLKYIEFPVKVVYHEYGLGVGGGLKIVRELITGLFLQK